MAANRTIPEGMINPLDAARMIVRSSLIVAPADMREKYTSFCAPVNMGRDYGDEDFITPEVRDIFDKFVGELTSLQKRYLIEEKTPLAISTILERYHELDKKNIPPNIQKLFINLDEKSTPSNIPELIANLQVATVLCTARKYIKTLEMHQATKDDETTNTILQQLRVITENISTRKIVLTYPAPLTSVGGLYGSSRDRDEDKEWVNPAILKAKQREEQKLMEEADNTPKEPEENKPGTPEGNASHRKK